MKAIFEKSIVAARDLPSGTIIERDDSCDQHEAVHLAVPDHSAKFWLTVQSLCPETERAKQMVGWQSGEESESTSNVSFLISMSVKANALPKHGGWPAQRIR